jgi:hypothetical protein
LIVSGRIDPEKDKGGGFASLSELLSHLETHGGNAAVVVALKAPKGQTVPSGAETERIAAELINRAEKETGTRVSGSNVFHRLGRFVLDGPAEVIRHVSSQPEVEEVTPNEYRGFGLIEPVRRRPVEGP